MQLLDAALACDDDDIDATFDKNNGDVDVERSDALNDDEYIASIAASEEGADAAALSGSAARALLERYELDADEADVGGSVGANVVDDTRRIARRGAQLTLAALSSQCCAALFDVSDNDKKESNSNTIVIFHFSYFFI